ncbi:MAG: ABC-2 type transport system ATP-binding protein [Pseudohongiellaceae bacterium]|jgi:ABC-2 type transport system ATP-binding protein
MNGNQRADTTAKAPSLAIAGLKFGYGDVPVLQGIDLEVPAGTVFGYIGPNGAGKSTTVRILVGIQQGFRGTVKIDGIDVAEDPIGVKERVGYVPESAALYEVLSVHEQLRFVGRLRGMDDDVIDERARELLTLFELHDRLDARISSLSKGMRQKVLFSSALLHKPQMLVLDEPLSGLDVGSTMLVKELLAALASTGVTVFYCSHMMDVVERVCDRIAVLDGGRIVADGTFDELSRDAEGGSLERVFAELTGAGDARARVDQWIQGTGP